MSMPFTGADLATAVSLMLKVTLVVAAAAAAQALLPRRTSAAARHLVWMLAIADLLLLPALSALLPSWELPVRLNGFDTPAVAQAPATPAVTAPPVATPATTSGAIAAPAIAASAVAAPAMAHPPTTAPARSAPAEAAVASTTPPSPSPSPSTSTSALAPVTTGASWSTVWLGLPALYLAGVLFLLARLVAQRGTVRRLARGATAVPSARGTDDEAWTRHLRECAASMGVRRPVRLLRSREQTMPMAFGTRRPSILIPLVADTWTDDRRRAVLLHELAHVARHDCLTQMLASVACALYWIHPGVWWIAKRLRVERELACDDRVLAAGTHARDYAGHLLELAYSLGGSRAPALVVSMAQPRQLEGRMLAILDAARNRTTPGPRGGLIGAAIAAALLLPLAGVGTATTGPETRTAAAPADEARPPASAQPAGSAERPSPGESFEALLAPMLKRVRTTLMSAAGLVTDAFQDAPLPGTWEIRPGKTAGTVHLRISEGRNSHGTTVPVDRLEGLSSAQLTAAGGPVTFRIRREAGTFVFEGVMRNGTGAGMFTFEPSATFAAELAKRGLERPTHAQQYALARGDVGLAFLDELTTQKYERPRLADIVRAADHGVNLDYLRGMGAQGYRLGSLDPLITLRDHGVTPDYISALAAEGYKGLPADEIRRSRDHGITPEYVREMRAQGYRSLTMAQLVNARDHGITPEYARELGEAGYRNLPLDELIRTRDHGITPAYVRELRDLGYTLDLPLLIKTRDHGVDSDFVREMAALGYARVPIEALIKTRDHGVNPKYVRDIKELGYDRIELDELVRLRDHGVTPDRIRAANARAGTRLPLDMLRDMR